MNDFELKSKLKSVRVPARTDEYWEEFPSRVRSQLPRPAAGEHTQSRVMPQWAWSGGLALACVISTLLLLPAFQKALRDERVLRARLPHQLHLLMADEHGMQYLVAGSDMNFSR